MLLPINSGNVTFQGTSIGFDQDVYGIRWNDSKINITPGFTMSLEFTANQGSSEGQSIYAIVLSNLGWNYRFGPKVK